MGRCGGFMDFISIILNIISSIPLNIFYELEIVNTLFRFDMENKLVFVKELPNPKIPRDFIILSNNNNNYNKNTKIKNDGKNSCNDYYINFNNVDDKVNDDIKTNLDIDDKDININIYNNDDKYNNILNDDKDNSISIDDKIKNKKKQNRKPYKNEFSSLSSVDLIKDLQNL